jgi:outer membrane protein OmpA-like peptidoglycan-associated protein
MNLMRLAGLGLGAFLVACATTPATSNALTDAHTAVQQLSEQPDAAQTAGKPLQDARDTLAQADAAAAAHKSNADVEHLAYVARRQADLGEAMLAEAQARNQVSKADAERSRILLEARDREVAQAKQQADAAQQQANTAQQQAADAQQQLADMEAKKTERGMVVTLSDVLFDTGQDTLKPGADLNLDRLSKYLEGSPGTKIIVEGHTDSRGSDAYNDALSNRRAQSVAEALESHGVSADRIDAVGRGKHYPVASNDTAVGRQENRRVEIVFSDAKGQFPPGAERPG